MNRKRLIFFVSSDPHDDPKPAAQAYHFASVAGGVGLDAEVRLAGDGVRVAQLREGSGVDAVEALRDTSRQGPGAPYRVSLCPACVDSRAVSPQEIATIGGTTRKLGDILTEVAEGSSTLIYLG